MTTTTGTTKRAVLSDIHGNLEALKAVLADIERRGIKEEEIVCLGDIIGYGGDTVEVTDLVKQIAKERTIMGNHEQALDAAESVAVGGLVRAGIHRPAAESIVTARKQLKGSGRESKERLDFLTSSPLEINVIKDAVVGIHDFTQDGNTIYVLPKRLAKKHKIRGSFKPEEFFSDPMFKENTVVVLKGNDHTQYAVILGRDGKPYEPETNPFEIKSGEKAIVGVGSVGLARNQDPAFTKRAEKLGLTDNPLLYASYTLLKGREVEFVRVLYSPKEVRKRTTAEGMPDVFKARYPFLPKL